MDEQGPRHKDELRCGKCRYPIAGLTQPICPECGSDLRDVGVERLGNENVIWLVGDCFAVTIFATLMFAVPGLALFFERPLVGIGPFGIVGIAWLSLGALAWILGIRFSCRRWKRPLVPFDENVLRG